MRWPPRYETWEELLADTIAGNPRIPLEVTIFPPDSWRSRYLAMHIAGVGYTDTRRYRFGRNRRYRSVEYGRRMVYGYLAARYDVTAEIAASEGPNLWFEWSKCKWRDSGMS